MPTLLTQKEYTFLEVAKTIGKLSTCDRANVGAVIVRDGRCICWGYNGAPPGMPHCEENNHGWGDYDLQGVRHCRNATHAEANALAFAARQGISTDGATLFVSMSPCDTCSRLLLAAGILRVVFAKMYEPAMEASRAFVLLTEGGVTLGSYSGAVEVSDSGEAGA